MNLYVRYFDHECLAKSVDEALDFLREIKEIKLDSNAGARISTFLNSSNLYPFRLKVSFSNYVLFLKTEANSLKEFAEEKERKEQKGADNSRPQSMADRKRTIIEALNSENKGWYEATITFKRVVTMPQTQKCRYIDTRFTVRCKADSGMHCYNRIVEYLKSREDIDPRSQFPSAKSASFEYKFVGEMQ